MRKDDVIADVEFEEALKKGKPLQLPINRICFTPNLKAGKVEGGHVYGKDATCIVCGWIQEYCNNCRHWQWHAAGSWGCYRPSDRGFSGVIFPNCFARKVMKGGE